jgi:hypothetical protein
MPRSKCYYPEFYNLCRREEGHHEVIKILPNNKWSSKKLAISVPPHCIPRPHCIYEIIDNQFYVKKDYSEVGEFFRKLREDHCFSKLIISDSLDELYPAIKYGGWALDDIVLHGYDYSGLNLRKSYNDAVIYRKEYLWEHGDRSVYGPKYQPEIFHAVWFDEPQKSVLKVDWGIVLRDLKEIVNAELNTILIYTDYYQSLLGISRDWRAEVRLYCDEIADDGYNYNREEWKNAVDNLGMRRALINMTHDQNEWRDYLTWANELNLSEIWLWFPGGSEYNCANFWKDVESFCALAQKYGWAGAMERFVVDEVVWCQHPDCSKCAGVELGDKEYSKYWGHSPIGEICPIGKRTKRSIEQFVQKTFYQPFVREVDFL